MHKKPPHPTYNNMAVVYNYGNNNMQVMKRTRNYHPHENQQHSKGILTSSKMGRARFDTYEDQRLNSIDSKINNKIK